MTDTEPDVDGAPESSHDRNDLEARVREQLTGVLDPCSTFTEHPENIVDLGLVEDVVVADGDVTVHLLPTNQLCMYVPHMTEDIQTRVGSLPEVDSVTVEQVADQIWTQDRMSESAASKREAHFQERVAAHDLEPAYDGEGWADDVAVERSE